MLQRLLAIGFIFVCTSFAWGILGGTILSRTDSSDSRLRGRVQSVWGVAQVQQAPAAEFAVAADHGKRSRIVTVVPESSDVAAELALEYRQKGLLWYSTYKVDFGGDYTFRNPDTAARAVQFTLRFPATQALYDGLQFLVDGRAVAPVIDAERAYVRVDLAPRQSARLHVAYRSQGIDTWRYSFGERVNPVRNFHLRMSTDFADIDFPDNTLAPTAKRRAGSGWQLDWDYQNLLSGYQIGMDLPAKLQPGPLASQISFFAPVSLFFFFFAIFLITATRNTELHPMNYFFLAAAFFAFHLLFAYMVDHVSLYVSFATASLVSIVLVVSYLRVVVGPRFAFREAALAQLVYLVLFSFAFFFQGFTGLTITIGSILTLFAAMQMTSRVRWAEKFRRPGVPPPLPAQS